MVLQYSNQETSVTIGESVRDEDGNIFSLDLRDPLSLFSIIPKILEINLLESFIWTFYKLNCMKGGANNHLLSSLHSSIYKAQ